MAPAAARSRLGEVIALYLLFFCSGAAGLIYQVVWVREFGNVFGNTIHSAALVISVFMCGLGVGSALGGRWADRHYQDAPARLLRAYALVEAGIALLGFGVALALPRLGELSAAISAYTTDADGWYVLTPASVAIRYAIAVLLLGPITLLMGATLTLLIRHVVRQDVGSAGWKIGALYGVNTAGAALGCFLTDWVLIPAGGLTMTQLTAVGLNLVAALGALRLVVRWSASAPGAPGAAGAEPPSAVSPLFMLTAFAVALAGFAGLGMEIVWFRHLGALLESVRAVLSLILTVVLIGIWLGAVGAGALHRRLGQPVLLFVAAQTIFVVASLVGLATAEPRALAVARVDVWARLVPIVREVAVPALMLGATFPLANAIVQDAQGVVGRRAGLLYLANTIGAVAGALVVGFVLLPALGMQRTVTVLVAVLALGLIPLALRALPRQPWPRAAAGASLLALGGALALWTTLPADTLVLRTLWPLGPEERRLTVHEGTGEIVAVTESPLRGRALLTNGHPMSGTGVAAQRYMRAFVHVPLLSQPAPERVLVVCFGVGTTAHAATLHPTVRRVDVVDTSRAVLAHAGYFAAANGGVLAHPAVRTHVNDGRQHLRMTPAASYDVITLEPPPIAFAGVGSLYSRDFYRLARSRLRPGGYLTQWLPVYQVTPDAALSMVRAFVEVFPQSVLLSGWMNELILVGTNGEGLEIDPARVEAALAANPALRADLERVHLATLTDLIGTFVASGARMIAVTDLYLPATDDLPLQEYALPSPGDDHRTLARLFDPGAVSTWCPACFVDGRPRRGLEGLPRHLALLAALYQHPSFREYHAATPRGRPMRLPIDVGAAQAALAGSAYLRALFTPVPPR